MGLLDVWVCGVLYLVLFRGLFYYGLIACLHVCFAGVGFNLCLNLAYGLFGALVAKCLCCVVGLGVVCWCVLSICWLLGGSGCLIVLI